MHRRIAVVTAFSLALSTLTWLSIGAAAQIAVSANDNKIVNVDGVQTVVQGAPPDTVMIIDLGVSPPKIIAELNVPNSVTGQPQSVAVAPDESLALVASAMKLDPADPKKVVPDNRLTVIDLKANPPAAIATLEVGTQPNGVSFSPDGKVVLVANRGDGTISVFSVSGKALASVGKVQLSDPKSGPCHVAFLPDGKTALVNRDGDHRVSILSIDGTKVEDTKRFMVGGVRPYPLTISSKGDVAVVANYGGQQGDADTINVIDLRANPPRIADTISVGQMPESVAISPDGSHLAVMVQNGSQRSTSHPAFNDHSLVKVFGIEGNKLALVTQAKVGRWGQGMAWSRDGKTLLAQVMIEKELQVLSFNGKELKMTGAIKVNGGPAGIRTSER